MQDVPEGDGALERFGPATAEWFRGAFGSPTAAQAGAWDAISRGRHALVVAPTGSGKTLAAFLWALDRLASAPARPSDEPPATRVLYISPLKALAVDVERNLQAPLVGISRTAARLGTESTPVSVGIRSGDTPSTVRRALARTPPDILITTPESLYLMLTSQARETLREVDTVIIDEIHVLAASKRGAHLALSLERLDAHLAKPAQRIGLSATVRPADEVARFLAGTAPVDVVAPPSRKELDLRVVVPVDDMTAIPGVGDDVDTGSAARSINGNGSGGTGGDGGGSIWPHIEADLLDRILAHRSTIVFANSRGLAERVTARLNELYQERTGEALAEEEATRSPAQMAGASGQTRGSDVAVARAHHGSVSKEQRALIEDELKSGRLRCVVATSSLELGIDMGAVDLVVQVASPPSVSSAMQRIGRAGHQVGEVSRGVLYPKTRLDLIGAAVTVLRMREAKIEQLRIPANPLDVLAQQTVAAAALETLDVEEWFDTVRRSAPFASLPRSAFDATLDLLSGRYPSTQFAELRPRLVWDREAGTLTPRPGAQRLAVTSGGTIPDRGQFGVFIAGDSAERAGSLRVGELDEEMVYESRVNDVFALGATSWRIREITHDRVVVTPAPGQPGRLPFWHGDGPGRPAELGAAQGAFVRHLEAGERETLTRELAEAGLEERAVDNLLSLIDEQKEATGRLPTDRTLLVERVRDELGDWRLILHSPYGMNVHAPWSLAVAARIQERYGTDGNCVAGDDGIVARIPDTDAEPPGADLFLFEPDELGDLVTSQVGGSALFASRFRECSARALLLPRRDPGRRSPLWQQRQRASQLLDVAREYPEFPMLLETAREVLQDVYDLPGLLDLTRRIARRDVRVSEVQTDRPSPFAQGMLFGYVAAFLYEGDSPLAERRAAALTLDDALLAELLGRVELRELLDAEVIRQTERELQRLADDRKATGAEGVADLVRVLGPLTSEELAERLRDTGAVAEHVSALERAGRLVSARIGGVRRWAAVEDAGRLRGALGVPLPLGVPEVFQEGGRDPLAELLLRYARTHGPFGAGEVAERFGLGAAVAASALHRLAADDRLREGEFRPGGTGTEWVDPGVFRRLRSRSLAALRKAVEPVEPAAFARFLPEWQGVGSRLRGTEGVLAVIEQLAGVPVPASAWETLVLPARVADYAPSMLDELTVSGEVLWSGAGSLAGRDGWVCLHPAAFAPATLRPPVGGPPEGLPARLLEVLAAGGGHFFRALVAQVEADDDAVAEALWDLVWAGLASNDTIAPLRSRLGPRNAHRASRPAPRPRLLGGGRASARLPRPALAASPSGAGRWFALPAPETDGTERAHATAELLLDRYGVVTRGSVQTEGIPGGFAATYRVLGAFEEAGRCVRGYVIEGLGAAQFAISGAVDRLRAHARLDGQEPPDGVLPTVVLAATDPANPFGAALPWPAVEESGTGHRPGRKAGALVVIRDGDLVLYLERGGRTVLAFTQDRDAFADASRALAAAAQNRSLGRLTVESVNGAPILGSDIALAMQDAGFLPTPRGVRLHARG